MKGLAELPPKGRAFRRRAIECCRIFKYFRGKKFSTDDDSRCSFIT